MTIYHCLYNFYRKNKIYSYNKRDNNNSFLSVKDYNDLIERVEKKMSLKTVREMKTNECVLSYGTQVQYYNNKWERTPY